MKRADFSRIDWQLPWFFHYSKYGLALQRAAQKSYSAWLACANELMQTEVFACNHARQPIEFISSSESHSILSYEQYIAQTGKVATRDHFHDFFNALMWLYFPKSKAALNTIHAQQMALLPKVNQRGMVRDSLTLMDESGLLLLSADDQMIEALRSFNWISLFVEQREKWGKLCQVALFGHALLEKLLSPYKACTAHVWVMRVEPSFFSQPHSSAYQWIDAQFAKEILAGHCLKKNFSPLPVLGIPNWSDKNQQIDFYLDKKVFRQCPKKR